MKFKLEIISNPICRNMILYEAPDQVMKEIFDAAIQEPRIQELLKTECLLGENITWENPVDFYSYMTINQANATHLILSTYWDGLILRGDVKLLYDTITKGIWDKLRDPDTRMFIPRFYKMHKPDSDYIERIYLITFDIIA